MPSYSVTCQPQHGIGETSGSELLVHTQSTILGQSVGKLYSGISLGTLSIRFRYFTDLECVQLDICIAVCEALDHGRYCIFAS